MTKRSETELRRLDALFAERVLGLKPFCIHWNNVFGSQTFERWAADIPYIPCTPPKWEKTTTGQELKLPGIELPHYTRSLDAAWEGVRPALATKNWITGPPHMSLWFEGTTLNGGETRVSFGSPCGRFRVDAVSSHPAEALVLACLRAVGVNEKELNP